MNTISKLKKFFLSSSIGSTTVLGSGEALGAHADQGGAGSAGSCSSCCSSNITITVGTEVEVEKNEESEE